MQVGMDFGSLLDRFLIDFETKLGAKLGAKLGPSWHQNRKKRGTKTMSKNHQKSGDARVRGKPRVANVLAPNNTTILTILTVLAAGSWLAVQSPLDTSVGHKARGQRSSFLLQQQVQSISK